MRLIPKNTKVKMQFYKGVTFPDLAIGLSALALVTLILTSNLPYRVPFALSVACLCIPLFLKVGEEKIYLSGLYLLGHLFSKKKYRKGSKDDTAGFFPFEKIDGSCIVNKDGTFTGVIEIKPLEFRLLSENKQDYLIETVAAVLNNLSSGQEAAIVKLEKSLELSDQIGSELKRIEDLIRVYELGELAKPEYMSRLDILEDRLMRLDCLQSNGNIRHSAFYFVLFDRDQKNLVGFLEYVQKRLRLSNIETDILAGSSLTEFLSLSLFSERPSGQDGEKESELSGLVPEKLDFRLMSTLQDGRTLTHFAVSDYPLKVGNAWGSDLFDIENTKVVMKLKSVEKSKAVRRIDNAILELSSQNKGKASTIIDKTTHVETLSSLLVNLQNDNETLFDVTLIVTAYDEKGKNTVKKAVRRKLKELGMSFCELAGRQSEAYLTTGISPYDKVNLSRGIQASSIAACFPFVSDAVVEPDGILIGENNLPVLLDFFKRDDEHVNSNMVIIGKSGSGKSYAAKTLLANLASCNTKIFVLDPEGEYTKLTESLSGKVLDAASAKHGKINPFQIIGSLDDENEDGTKNSFFSHLQFLEEFFKLILSGLDTDSLELVNQYILELYSKKGITPDTNFLRLKSEEYPTMEDLACLVGEKLASEKNEAAKSCLKKLVTYLSKFRGSGRNSALWNGASSFSAAENFVCFNFQKLFANKNSAVANAQMLLILKWLENEVIKNRDYNRLNGTNRKIAVVIDEAHVFIDEKYPIALDFMFQLAKRIRKYDGMQIVITQNVKDFAGTAETARKSMAIINVSQYSLIFSLSPNDMTDLCALYQKAGQINEAESDAIIYNPRGCAFLISSPSQRTNIRISATPHIESLFKNENE